jgi:hypothetical protein
MNLNVYFQTIIKVQYFLWTSSDVNDSLKYQSVITFHLKFKRKMPSHTNQASSPEYINKTWEINSGARPLNEFHRISTVFLKFEFLVSFPSKHWKLNSLKTWLNHCQNLNWSFLMQKEHFFATFSPYSSLLIDELSDFSKISIFHNILLL